MSTAKETWIAATAVSSRVGLPVVASPSGRLICNVNCVTDKTFGKMPGDDAFNREALEHARTISAAPDALEALRLHAAYEAMPRDRGGRSGPRGKAWEKFVAARDAAIAKAEGRS